MNKNKLQLLREYLNLCVQIMRVRHEVSSAKDTIQRTKQQINTQQITPEYLIGPDWHEWGEKYPCNLTRLRNGMQDMYTGDIFNFGTPDEIKTFQCPFFSWNKKCTRLTDCKYKGVNTEYINAKHTLKTALNTYNAVCAQRAQIRKQIFTRRK